MSLRDAHSSSTFLEDGNEALDPSQNGGMYDRDTALRFTEDSRWSNALTYTTNSYYIYYEFVVYVFDGLLLREDHAQKVI